MSSSNQKDQGQFLDFLNENDFIEMDKKRKNQIAKEHAEEVERRRIEALPKITDEDLKKASQSGYERGLQEGIRQGQEAAAQQFQQHLAQLSGMIENIDPQLKKFQAMNQKQAITMCEQVFTTLSDAFAKQYPVKVLQQNIQRTFYYAPVNASLIVRLHPDSNQYLSQVENNPLLSEENKTRITFKNDDTLNIGDCAIEWDETGIEARFIKARNGLSKLLESTMHGVSPDSVELPELEGATQDTSSESTPETEDQANNEEPIATASEAEATQTAEAISEEESSVEAQPEAAEADTTAQ